MSTPGRLPSHELPPPSPPPLRRRLAWTVVLVLAALGGAGLATAADREPTDLSRPELTWRAEQRVAPLVHEMSNVLAGLAGAADQLAAAGRRSLAAMSAAESDDLDQAIDDGDQAVVAVGEQSQALAALRDAQQAAVADWRLSRATRAGLNALDEAIAAANELPDVWGALRAAASEGAGDRLARALVRIEQVRGKIAAARAALGGSE